MRKPTGLVLTRKIDSIIEIKKGNEAIYVKVIQIKGSQIRLMIEAPSDYKIMRMRADGSYEFDKSL